MDSEPGPLVSGQVQKTAMIGQQAEALFRKYFHHFSLLPPEIRHLVYSKLMLYERVSASKTCPEMEAYFLNRRVAEDVFMSLAEENNNAYVKIEFCRSSYWEMHKIPDDLVPTVRRDLQSSVGCTCCFCQYFDRSKGCKQIRYLEYSTHSSYTVFQTIALINLPYISIKSAPVGGLVDLLQPSGRCNIVVEKKRPYFIINWHQLEGVRYKRNDPTFSVENWRKWFDFVQPSSVSIEDNNGKHVDGLDSDGSYWEYGPIVYVHKDLFSLEAIQNVESVHLDCSVDISLTQLMTMKATSISLFETKSECLTKMELLEFYKAKIQEWLTAPGKKFCFRFDSAERGRNQPHLDYKKLLANVREQLESPDFRVYPNFDFYRPSTAIKGVTVRSMKSGLSLVVRSGMLSSGVRDKYFGKTVWPDKHGF